MATALTRPIVRLVATSDKRALVVKFAPEGIYIREPGQRWSSALLCPWGVAWYRAAWLAAEAKKRARLEARKAKAAARKEAKRR